MNAWQLRRERSGWSGGYVEWTDGDTVNLSVVFSWRRQMAYQRAVWWRSRGYRVRVGGPAVYYDPAFFEGVAEVGYEADALVHHNPRATFTSRGCIRRCPFCAVPRIEGDLVELDDWSVKPIVCDNNLLACSEAHFDQVIDRLLESGIRGVDFNQGLDARLLTEYHAARLAELHRAGQLKCVRLAWDDVRMEAVFRCAHRLLRDAGIPKGKVSVYVLIGFNDTPEDALYRLREVWALGAWPNPMRYQPLDAEKRNEYVAPGWTDRELKRYMRYWSNLRHLSAVPFAEYGG